MIGNNNLTMSVGNLDKLEKLNKLPDKDLMSQSSATHQQKQIKDLHFCGSPVSVTKTVSFKGNTHNDKQIVMISMECDPLMKAGGMGDIIKELPGELNKAGMDTRVFTPFFSCEDNKSTEAPLFKIPTELDKETEKKIPIAIDKETKEKFEGKYVYKKNNGEQFLTEKVIEPIEVDINGRKIKASLYKVIPGGLKMDAKGNVKPNGVVAPTYLVHSPSISKRVKAYDGNCFRDASYFGKAVVKLLKRMPADENFDPQYINTTDWHTAGIVETFKRRRDQAEKQKLPEIKKMDEKNKKFFSDRILVHTIHNCEYQGQQPPLVGASRMLGKSSFSSIANNQEVRKQLEEISQNLKTYALHSDFSKVIKENLLDEKKNTIKTLIFQDIIDNEKIFKDSDNVQKSTRYSDHIKIMNTLLEDGLSKILKKAKEDPKYAEENKDSLKALKEVKTLIDAQFKAKKIKTRSKAINMVRQAIRAEAKDETKVKAPGVDEALDKEFEEQVAKARVAQLSPDIIKGLKDLKNKDALELLKKESNVEEKLDKAVKKLDKAVHQRIKIMDSLDFCKLVDEAKGFAEKGKPKDASEKYKHALTYLAKESNYDAFSRESITFKKYLEKINIEIAENILNANRAWGTNQVGDEVKLDAKGKKVKARDLSHYQYPLGRVPNAEWADQKYTFNAMRQSLYYPDKVTTVAPFYMTELMDPNSQMANGVEEILSEQARQGRTMGILNGLNPDEFDPQHDKKVVAEPEKSLLDPHKIAYRLEDINNQGKIKEFKLKNKQALQAQLNKSKMDQVHENTNKNKFTQYGYLEKNNKATVATLISRFDTNQKGIDTMINCAEQFLQENPNAQIIIGGPGYNSDKCITKFKEICEKYSGRATLCDGFIANMQQFFAGSDIALVPSNFEPCGLTQLQAMRMGAVPVVSDSGGLHDTVKTFKELGDKATGFRTATELKRLNEEERASELLKTLTEAYNTHQKTPEKWGLMAQNALKHDSSWKKSLDEGYLSDIFTEDRIKKVNKDKPYFPVTLKPKKKEVSEQEIKTNKITHKVKTNERKYDTQIEFLKRANNELSSKYEKNKYMVPIALGTSIVSGLIASYALMKTNKASKPKSEELVNLNNDEKVLRF